MDAIDVPIYKQAGHDRIDEVLDELRRKKRGGVLIQDGGKYQLLFAGDLLRARHTGIRIVQRVPGGHPVMVTNETHARSHGVDLHEPLRTRPQFESILDHFQFRYTVPIPRRTKTAAVGPPKVVTRSEELGQMLRMTGGYECNGEGEEKHFFPEPYVDIGDPCPFRPECKRLDGSVPRIIASI